MVYAVWNTFQHPGQKKKKKKKFQQKNNWPCWWVFALLLQGATERLNLSLCDVGCLSVRLSVAGPPTPPPPHPNPQTCLHRGVASMLISAPFFLVWLRAASREEQNGQPESQLTVLARLRYLQTLMLMYLTSAKNSKIA